MTKDEKINRLKRLRVARECALHYDYVPGEDEAKRLIEDILPESIAVEYDELKDILFEYEGNSPDNIDNYIIEVIDIL